MKRKIFAAFAVLLAFMLATCDLVEPPSAAKDDSPKFTPDGRPMVRLSINVGNNAVNKSISRALVKSEVDWYEVAFVDPYFGTSGDVYRKAWASTSGNVYVPQGNYTSGNYAVLFAGKKNGDGTNPILLAVGVLSNTGTEDDPLSGGGTTTKIINGDTKEVEFTLTMLTNDVKADKDDSTFKIIGPPDYKTESIASAFPTKSINSVSYPAFMIPGGELTPDDDFDHGSLPYTGNDLMGHYQINIPHKTLMVLQGTWGFQSAGQPFGSDVTGVTVTATPKYPGTAAGTSIDGDFYFLITVPDESNGGLSKIYIDVPVYAINSTSTTDSENGTTAGIWHIQGGTVNMDLDGGTGTTGGAVLLEVEHITRTSNVGNIGPSSSW